jgi:hypothetical protein
MKFYTVEPEVAGGLGKGSILDRTSGNRVVQKLNYEFDGWPVDELLESTPCFIASEKLRSEIEHAKLEGVWFDNVEITKSDEFEHSFSGRSLPQFSWMKITGKPGVDDFGIASDLRLVVSDPALAVLKSSGIAHALIGDFVPKHRR